MAAVLKHDSQLHKDLQILENSQFFRTPNYQ